MSRYGTGVTAFVTVGVNAVIVIHMIGHSANFFTNVTFRITSIVVGMGCYGFCLCLAYIAINRPLAAWFYLSAEINPSPEHTK